uniref:FLYWCH-type domain-containing protein n=1 Tax=Meloidogyne hapla TaxID=6305 RepID=A0A1I8AXA7_MELHA
MTMITEGSEIFSRHFYCFPHQKDFIDSKIIVLKDGIQVLYNKDFTVGGEGIGQFFFLNRKIKMLRIGEIDTEKGKKKLNLDGRLYVFDKLNSTGSIKFWRCEFKMGDDKCKGRMWTTLEDEFIRMVTPHTCEHNPARIVAH